MEEFLRLLFGGGADEPEPAEDPVVVLPTLNVAPPEERRREIPLSAEVGDHGESAIEELFDTPLVRDTLSSITQALNPEVSVRTKGRPGWISGRVGEFDPEANEILIEAGYWPAVREGLIIGESDPDRALRQTLLHEVGHSLGASGTVRGEVAADLFAALIGELSASTNRRGITREGVVNNAFHREQFRRERKREAGAPPSAYTAKIGDEFGRRLLSEWLDRMLERTPIFTTHPARFNND